MDLQVGARVGHVRLERLLGRGGMGEVWEGFDELLHRRVALKAIHQERRASPGARERFLREARLLSQIDHPNVCRVHELVETPGADCLVLELVEGTSLGEVAADSLSWERKLAIGAQIATALQVAHERRIVHRDLKPENVMLTPGGDIKVLDFGVARSAAPDDDTTPAPATSPTPAANGPIPATLDLRPSSAAARSGSLAARAAGYSTEPGTLVGTPRYMSPEQAEGRPVGPATDLYSLGVLLQELFTGASAYPPSRNLAELRERVRRAELVALPEDLDPDLVRLLRRLQAPDPARRPSAAEAAATLAAIREKPARRRRRRLALAAVVTAGLALAAAVALTWRLSRPEPLIDPMAEVRIAVLPFRNATGDAGLDWVDRGLQQMVATALARGGRFAVADPQATAEAVQRLDFGGALSPGPEELGQLARSVGSDLLVATAVAAGNAGIRLEATIYDRGGPLAREEVTAEDPIRASRTLAERLGHRLDPAAPTVDLQEAFSRDGFANQAYAIGVQRSRTAGPAAALPYLQVSVDRDPDFARARLELANATFRSGDPETARTIATAVADDAATRGDLALQVAAVRQLAELAQEAGAYAEAESRIEEALALLAKAPDPEVEVRTLNHLGVLRYRQGDFEAAERHLQTGLAIARERGLENLTPPLLTPLAYIRLQTGKRDEAEPLFEEILATSRRFGHREWEAGALTNIANLRLQKGDLEAAARFSQEAHDVFREIGSVKGQLVTLVNLGAVRLHQGDLAEAERLSRDALALARELGDRRSETFSLSALGYFASRRGRLDEADATLATAAPLVAEIGDRELTWQLARNLAWLRALQGRTAEARRELDRATAIKRDGLTILAEARLAYAEGRFGEAASLIDEARERKDFPWASWRDAVLATYREAAVEGRPLPLPDEPSEAAPPRS